MTGSDIPAGQESWTSCLQKCDRIDFYCLSHPVCGILLWQTEQTDKPAFLVCLLPERGGCLQSIEDVLRHMCLPSLPTPTPPAPHSPTDPSSRMPFLVDG